MFLTHYKPNLPIIVPADDSNYGVSALIAHVFSDGLEKALAHISQTLTTIGKTGLTKCPED